jgi:hypothetical protein
MSKNLSAKTSYLISQGESKGAAFDVKLEKAHKQLQKETMEQLEKARKVRAADSVVAWLMVPILSPSCGQLENRCTQAISHWLVVLTVL